MNNYVKRDNFYVFLPSNSSMDVFPKNKQSQYCTQLAAPIQLDGSWEVGLAEIHIPAMWQNVTKSNNTFMLKYTKSIPATVKHTLIKQNPGFFDFKMIFNRNYATQFNYLTLLQEFIQDSESDFLRKDKWNNALSLKFDLAGYVVYATLTLKKGFSMFINSGKNNESVETIKNKIFMSSTLLTDTLMTGPLTIDFGEIDNDEVHKIMPHNIYITNDDEKPVVIETEKLESREIEKNQEVSISVGCYKTRLDLINALNSAVKTTCQDKLSFSLNENNRLKVWCINAKKFNIRFNKNNKNLATMLGLDWKRYSESDIIPTAAATHEHIFKYPIDLKNDVYGMYIYSDIITQQFVGDRFANLLRVVPVISSITEELNVNIFSAPHYLDLSRNYINNIYIELKSAAGDFVIFEGGCVLCLLHFRKKI